MWRLKEEAAGADKKRNAQLMKEKLEALHGQIPGLLKIELGINFAESDSVSDVVLCTEFATQEDLNSYVVHPLHKAVGVFVREVVAERRMVDYSI
jgi:hypothetical protein